MFWNKSKQPTELERWAEGLEAGIGDDPSDDRSDDPSDDPTLAMAAQLRTTKVAHTTPNPFFKAQTRRRLLVLHDELTSTAQTSSRQQHNRRWGGISPRRLILIGLILLLLLSYWQRLWWIGLFTPRVDDWQFTALAVFAGRLSFITILLHALISKLLPYMIFTLFSLLAISLSLLLIQRLRARWQPQFKATGTGSQLPQKGLRFSGALAILCVGMLFFLWNQQPVQHQTRAMTTQSPLAIQHSQPIATTPQQPVAQSDTAGTTANEQAAAALEAIVPATTAIEQPAAAAVGGSTEELAAASADNLALADAAAPAQPDTAAGVLTYRSGNAPAQTALVVPATSSQIPGSIIANESIGLAVGGAKDINNFRENIEQGYLPLPTDVTVEGLFYDYYFATGQQAACTQLFCPSYTQATSRDPISGEAQHFLAVGLNSGLRASDFARKRLNLVIALDISGSMGEAFDQYYYDSATANSNEPVASQWDGKPKIAVATAAIAALLDQLQADDRLAIVLFDDQAYQAKGMRTVGETDMASIKQHILTLREQGGTNMEAGYRMATDLLSSYANVDPNVYENRIIFLTDAQPNTGMTGQADLLALTQTTAAQRIYTTFIGIGVDFNTQLIEGLTKVRGANYYAAHSPTAFMRRMDDEFDFMVTPLLFDLTLTFNSPDFVIEQVYGSPEADAASGEVMRINTLFPSASHGGAVKGGLVLLQLAARNGATASAGQATLTVTYADRAGNLQSSAATVTLPSATGIAQGEDQFDNSGIRKGILLVRYANLLRNWINDERGQAAGLDDWSYPSVNTERGIRLPQHPALGQWERQSMPLQVSPAYRALFAQFRGYFLAEVGAVQDATLQQEVTILARLGE